MKQIWFAGPVLALVLALVGVSPAAAQQQGQVAYINSQRILAEAPGTAEAQQAFEADMQQYQSEVEQLGEELEELRTSYDRQQATLSEDARQQRQQEIQQTFAAYQQRVQELEQTAQRRQAELVQPIMQRISEVIEEIRTEGGYALIFDAAAGGLITADPALDLTDQVLGRLQTEGAAGQ